MTRISGDELKGGRVHDGFDYNLQVWVRGGVVEDCAHPESMRACGRDCCAQHRLAGRRIEEVEGAETFPVEARTRPEVPAGA